MDATLLVQYKALYTPTLTLPNTLFSTFWLFPSFLLKINAFTIFEKGEKKKSSAKGGIEPLVDRVKKTWLVIYHLCHWSWCFSSLCCASSGSSCTLIDRCLIQSAVSNLFPNQWCCLKLYLPLPVCLICRCVFWLVILFFIFAFAFVICYFVFRIVICFALIGHRTYVTLEHKTSHKGKFFQIEIYAVSERLINNISIDVWFVMIWQYLAEIQLFVNLESEGAKKSKYWENHL